MFDLDFLNEIRSQELDVIRSHLLPGQRVLEIGGGTGLQAKQLTELGFDVVSIDVASSNYRSDRVFPVQDYDGRSIPYPDGSFDVVFSSNVLEHVIDLSSLLAETRRVLRPGGYGLHIMPTAAWRFWTTLTHYADLPRGMARVAAEGVRGVGLSAGASAAQRLMKGLLRPGKHLVTNVTPERHGETGTAVGELWRFNRFAWQRVFRRNGFIVDGWQRVPLFYTGTMLLGPRVPVAARSRASGFLGSACILYRVHPQE